MVSLTLSILFIITLLVLAFNVWLMRDLVRYLITLVREIHETIVRRR